tara:strand:+ start:5287 stop:5439 length:153 start_codon:yes stop_codon:yes gene_type:complete
MNFVDTLKTTGIGGTSFMIQCIEYIPEVVRVLVGIVTIIYLIVQIKKDSK